MALLKQYDDFLLNNASQITAVESSLRSITYFLPGRFKDAELAGEAIYASLNLLGLYHDSILARALEKQNPLAITNDKALAAEKRVLPSSAARLDTNIATGLTPSEHARYTNHFSHSSKSYNRVARSLVIVGYFELLAEMVARRKLGRRKAWDVVAAIEALKVLLRLSLVQMTGSRMAIHPPIPEREVDPAALEQERANIVGKLAHRLDVATASSSSSLSNSITQPPKGYWKGSRTGLLRPTLASLRPGYDDTEDDPPASAAQPDRRPPHLRAMRINAAHSGSDTDDTLVDSTRLQASTTLYPSAASDDPLSQSSNALQKDLPSPPVTMKPWSESQINDYLLSRVLTVNDVRKPEELVRPLRNRSAHLAEVVWILRPLIYVLALRRWGRKATLPFALSFALEYFAKELRIRSFAPSIPAPKSLFPTNPLLAAMMGQNPLASILTSIFMGGNPADKAKRPISSVEEAEWSKRANSFWWYLLRGPLWYSFTRPKLSGLVQRTHGKFLIGMVGGVLSDYLPLIDEYYYYSAT